MRRRRIVALVTFCAMIFGFVFLVSDQAFAGLGSSTSGLDKELGLKQEGDVLAGKKKDASKTPSKLQMAIGFGSIFVMIAVVKWL